MTPEQIADERRQGRRAAVAAVAASILSLIAAIWAQALSADAPERNTPALLRYFDGHIGELIGSSALRGIALLLLLPVTLHLWRATKARRPEEPQVVLVTGLYGPAAAGIGTILVAIALALGASGFVDREFQTLGAADDAFDTVRVIGLLSFSGTLALAFWFVKGSLDAMRVGLLNRLTGIVGVMIGPGIVIFAVPFWFLLSAWLLVVAAIFAGLALRELPPAWEAGKAVTAPSPRERLGALDDGLRTTPNGEVGAVGPGVGRPGRDEAPRTTPPGRKRKRRR